MKIPNNKSELICIFTLYLVISVILTYPLFFLSDGLIGPKEDNLVIYWNAWHFKKAVFDEDEKVFFTKDIFYPAGVSLLFHAVTPSNLVLAFFFNFFLSLAQSYNLVVFIAFPLSAFFTFLLCFYLTKNKLASFVGGFIFAFSPYHIARSLHHLNLATIYAFPLLALFFLKLKDKPSLKYGLIVGIILALTAFTSYYYLIFSFAFLFLGWLYFSFFSENKAKFFKYFICSIIIGCVIISPLIISMFLELKNNTYYTPGGYDFFVLDIFSFITPSPGHTFFGKFTQSIYNRFTGNWWESEGYLGFAALLLLIFSLVKNYEKRKEKHFFLLLFFIAIILSLGASLHILGNRTIPLPYSFLRKIPIFSMARSVSRWVILSYLSLAVLASFGLKKMLQKIKGKQKYMLYSVVFGLIIFEYLAVPLESIELQAPSFYYNISADNSDYAVFDIPCNNYMGGVEFMFFQTIHNKKILYAIISRTPEEAYSFLKNTGLLEFCSLNNISSINKKALIENRIKYVILHKHYLDENKTLILATTLENEFSKVFEDKKIIAYEVY